MDNLYSQLGFIQPEFLQNPYGIRIYLGTKDKEDWCVEIPKELCAIKCNSFKFDKNFMCYLVSEDYALEMAKLYTEIAVAKEKEAK